MYHDIAVSIATGMSLIAMNINSFSLIVCPPFNIVFCIQRQIVLAMGFCCLLFWVCLGAVLVWVRCAVFYKQRQIVLAMGCDVALFSLPSLLRLLFTFTIITQLNVNVNSKIKIKRKFNKLLTYRSVNVRACVQSRCPCPWGLWGRGSRAG